MDEVHELCRRVLGNGALADQAAAQAYAAGRRSRVTRLAAATEACRAVAERATPEAVPGTATADPTPEPLSLTATVSGELSEATSRLPELDREVLVLRELLRLTYREIARAMQIKPATVGPLLANARLGLRAERRGPLPDNGTCAERERALGLLARRQDSEPVTTANQEWLLSHMARCPDCEIAHAAMLEASVCYRAWR